MSAIDQFREALRIITATMENAAITDFIYWQVIQDAGIISPDALQQRVEEASRNPELRDEVRKMYSETWKVLEKVGTDAFFEDLLKDLPPTDKPN